MLCDKCIHKPVCKFRFDAKIHEIEKLNFCCCYVEVNDPDNFIIKGDFMEHQPIKSVVEVVRCSECYHYNPSCCGNGLGWCEYYNTGATDEHYCSHGEREGN